jgi:DNA-binding response OmpR family regulator
VIEARDGDDAVAQFREHGEIISLVILDMILPRKNGREVFDLISACRAGVNVIFVSGYPDEVIDLKSLLPEGAVFLQKPVLPLDLLAAMRRILDGECRGDGGQP